MVYLRRNPGARNPTPTHFFIDNRMEIDILYRISVDLLLSSERSIENGESPLTGCLQRFRKRSHFSRCSPNGATEWNNREEESILCNAGDVVLFRSEVWHRGSANTSDEVRYLMQVHYAQRMITQKYPPYLNKFQFDASILARASPGQRRLLGDHRPSNYD